MPCCLAIDGRAEPAREGLDAFQIRVVRFEIRCRRLVQPFLLLRPKRDLKRLRDLGRHSRLDVKHVRQNRVVVVLPSRHGHTSIGDLVEFRREANAARLRGLVPADFCGQQVRNAELLCDFGRRLSRALVLIGARARDDLEPVQAGELAAHFVGHPIGEIVVLRRAEILKREHSDAFLLCGRRGDRCVPRRRKPQRGDNDEKER